MNIYIVGIIIVIAIICSIVGAIVTSKKQRTTISAIDLKLFIAEFMRGFKSMIQVSNSIVKDNSQIMKSSHIETLEAGLRMLKNEKYNMLKKD